MGLIDRYLFRQLVGPTVLATLSLGTVGVLSQSLEALDLIVKQGQSPLVLAEITLLASPQLLATVVPIAIFVAGLVALNRLHTEQEIVVCFSSGMSRWRVISPAIRLATIAALVVLAVNLWIAPMCERAMRVELFKIRTDLAATLVEPGQFTEPAPGLTVYVQDAQNGTLKNLFVLKEKLGGGDTTFIAASGKLGKRNGAPILTMRDGSSQEFSKTGVLNYLNSTNIRLIYLHLWPAKMRSVTSFLTDTCTSFFPRLTASVGTANRLRMLGEGNARLATPIYAFAAMAMALAAVLGGPFSRLGYMRRIVTAGAALTIIRMAGVAVQALCDNQAWLNVLQYLLPLAACGWAFQQIFRKPVSRFVPLPPLTGSTLMPAGTG